MSEENNPPPNNLVLLQIPRRSHFFLPVKEKKPIENREVPPKNMLSAAIEAVLFVSPEPLSISRINTILGRPGIDEIYSILRALKKNYEQEERGFLLMEVNRGWHFRTDPRFAKCH